MKTSNLFLFSLVILLAIFSCKDKDDSPTPPKPEPTEKKILEFVGDYKILYEQVSGIHTFYDSVGNIIRQGYDTTQVLDPSMSITESNHEDSLLLSGLLNSWIGGSGGGTFVDAKASWKNDTLNIFYEKRGASVNNNYIRGEIWLKGDSIFLDYRWDKSDAWSQGALPIFGKVKGKGVVIK